MECYTVLGDLHVTCIPGRMYNPGDCGGKAGIVLMCGLVAASGNIATCWMMGAVGVCCTLSSEFCVPPPPPLSSADMLLLFVFCMQAIMLYVGGLQWPKVDRSGPAWTYSCEADT